MSHNYPKHPEDGMVYACPECDCATVYHRVRTDDYRCTRCGVVFDNPDERRGRRGRFKGDNIISDDELLADLRRVCEAFDRGVTTYEYDQRGEYHHTTFSRRFGFREAVKQVGYEPVTADPPEPPKEHPTKGVAKGPNSDIGRKLMDMDPEDLGLSPAGERAD